jgi:serine/threonine protein kinase
MKPKPGEMLGHYQIVTALGSGGIGDVYRATDLRLRRDVALKVFSRDDDRTASASLQKEARVASSLNHPNIVTIHDVGEKDSTPYIAMELVKGTTLREILKAGPLKLDQLLQVGEQIASGLAKAHELGIVHRDLKPENLMLTEDGLVKILDFGLAQSLSETRNAEQVTPQTTSPAFVGTTAYMSPEQVRGRTVDYRSDQFSLGIILYELALGVRPFQRQTAFQTLTAIAEEPHRPLCKANINIPVRFSTVVDKCLSKCPGDRFSSTQEIARQLGAITHQLGDTTNQSRRRVVAVLPFADMSSDASYGYVCEGLAEEIRTQLQLLKTFSVVSPFAIPSPTARSIHLVIPESLPDNLIGGSVRADRDRLRIVVVLIDTMTGCAVWSGKYDRQLKNVLALQTAVAKRILRSIEPLLLRSPEKIPRYPEQPTGISTTP